MSETETRVVCGSCSYVEKLPADHPYNITKCVNCGSKKITIQNLEPSPVFDAIVATGFGLFFVGVVAGIILLAGKCS